MLNIRGDGGEFATAEPCLRRNGLQLCILSSKHEVDDTPARVSHSQECWEVVGSEACLQW